MTGELIFNEAAHTYTLDGVRLPSVTQILGQYVPVSIGDLRYQVDVYNQRIVPEEDLNPLADIGTAIHLGCQFLLEGRGLDWEDLDESLIGPLRQFELWMSEYQVKAIMTEELWASEKWGFAGTCDAVAMVLGKRMLVDIKTGYPGLMVGPQTAAYECLYRENTGWTGQLRRAVLHVPRDGSPVKLKGLSTKRDWAFFKARLTQHNFITGRD